jgi:hypothetical protein
MILLSFFHFAYFLGDARYDLAVELRAPMIEAREFHFTRKNEKMVGDGRGWSGILKY